MTQSPERSRSERVALFQQWFSDTIPHNKALGLKVVAVRRGLASMQLDWREELVGNPETGVLAGGPLTAHARQLLRHVGGDHADRSRSPSRRSTCASTMPAGDARASR